MNDDSDHDERRTDHIEIEAIDRNLTEAIIDRHDLDPGEPIPNIQHLREHGPATCEELPETPRQHDFEVGMLSLAASPTRTAVYYLPFVNDSEAVSARYFEANGIERPAGGGSA